MNQMVDAFREFFVTATNSAGELAETANFALKTVNWNGPFQRPEAASHPILDRCLAATCTNAGREQSITNKVAKALLPVANQLTWRTRAQEQESDADLLAFSRNYSSTSIIGTQGLLLSDKVSAGFSLQGPDAYYPPHAHLAEESYWIIGGDGDWRVDANPWFAVKSGDGVYHKSGARHAMQTNEQPMLSIWLWTSHLDSEVMIIR